MTNAHSETGQMAVCCQNLTLGALTLRPLCWLACYLKSSISFWTRIICLHLEPNWIQLSDD